MGRVRKYKKFKSRDPYSKKSRVTGADDKHDEPPELQEERERRDAKRKERLWDDDNSRELQLQREAMRNIRSDEKKKLVNDVKVEGKREDESMKDFKTRIRQDTRNTLRDELKGLSATAKKRKERLKERKLKRKGLPGKASRLEYEEGFSCAANGHLRPSDLGGSDEFAKAQTVKFGERAECPPDFKGLLKFAEKPLLQKQQQQQQQQSRPKAASSSAAGRSVDANSALGSSQEQEPSKKRKKTSVTEIADGDDGLGHAQRKPASDGLIHAGNGSGKSSASVEEMELLRARVQLAYKAVQDKRRAARG